MECAAHPGITANVTCVRCEKALCSACAAYDVDAKASCESCGRDEEDRSHALGSAIVAFVAVGYLATLALAVIVFHAKPFVGGIAAVVAIALGRVLQLVVRPAVVVRRVPQRS